MPESAAGLNKRVFPLRLLLTALLLGLVVSGFYISSRYNYVLFHTLVELFSIAIGWSLFIIVWNARQWMKSRFLFILGVALAAAGGLDLVHTLSYKGLSLFPGYDSNLPTQLWIAARYLQSFSMLFALFFLKDSPVVEERAKSRLTFEGGILIAYLALVAVLLTLVFLRLFPDCYIEGQGLTPFKVISEYIISAILLAALVILWVRRQLVERRLSYLLIAAMFLTILSELAFTFYVGVYDFSNLLGHFGKLGAFYLIYLAVIETGLQRPYGLLFSNLDQQAAALREGERKFRLLIENQTDLLIQFDPQKNIQFANPASCAAFGKTPQEMLTGSYLALFSEEDRWRVEAAIRDVMTPPYFVQSEQKLYTVDGWRRFDWSMKAALSEDGQVTSIFSAGRDVTSEKNAEEAADARHAEMLAIFEGIDQPIYVADPQTYEMLFTNQAVLSLFGPVNHRKCYQYLQNQPAPCSFCTNPRIFGENEGQVYTWEYQNEVAQRWFRCIDRSVRWPDGRRVRYQMAVDITERKQAETSIVAAQSNLQRMLAEAEHSRRALLNLVEDQKEAQEQIRTLNRDLEKRVADRTADLELANLELARAARMKDEFLANMSHELRTPLTGILGLSEALLLNTYGNVSEKQQQILKLIEFSGEHLLELINEILDLSKIEAGKLDLLMENCSLAGVCQASLQMTAGLARKKQQQTSFSMVPETIILRADARRVKQMLVNLLSNAVKFTQEGGRLGIDVAGDAEHCQVRITVWDTGIGIEPENLPRLFQPFVQLDASLSRHYSGTGLGLSLVKGLAVLHGGSVEVASTPGQGSRFTVVLPWEVQDSPSAPGEVSLQGPSPAASVPADLPAALPEMARPLVFLVEDDRVIANLLEDFLSTENYRVVASSSGDELLARLEVAVPDILIADIQMPGMDGLEVIRRIRAHSASQIAGLPVIALTALAMPGDRERILAVGANQYLAKPVKLNALLSMIRELLRPG